MRALLHELVALWWLSCSPPVQHGGLAFDKRLVGLLLTGAGQDGLDGMIAIS